MDGLGLGVGVGASGHAIGLALGAGHGLGKRRCVSGGGLRSVDVAQTRVNLSA